MKFLIKSPGKNFSFESEFHSPIIETTEKMDSIILTIISTDATDGIVEDYCFQNVTISKEDGSCILTTQSKLDKLPLFAIVATQVECYIKNSSSMDVFNQYDGTILAYSNAVFLNEKRDFLSSKDVVAYMMTGYNADDVKKKNLMIDSNKVWNYQV